ncbi:hypothetical protein M2277_005024 [Paenibacillus sp. LBL]|uniref:DUF4262 domain-containing protein n=1 Tax=Paenibacillus sp. LBL TaxID=2940563 RepID=UPI0024755308|nr:DUF4262 domain-containing protein [Paenibacillus sp. LBL]MDH6674332.1 hypothetical protein [Paenibacillus sp. LBL]
MDISKMIREEVEMLKKHGWLMHAVPASQYDGVHANYHTHGVFESWSHMDFQITLDMNPIMAHSIIEVAVENVKEGFRYGNNKVYDNILVGMPVMMKVFFECDREVMRIVLPNKKGEIPSRTDGDVFSRQLDDYNFDAV